MEQEEERLLSYQKEGDADYFAPATRSNRQEWCRRAFPFYILTIHILLILSALSNVYQSIYAPGYHTRLSIFPELTSLPRILTPSHAQNPSIYAGRPNNSTAAAWTHLLAPFYFNLSATELSRARFDASSAVRVKEGGYLASLGVYHQLHCLNQFRNFLYTRDSHLASEDLQKHLDHCIDVLRQQAMCTADLSLYTFTWPATKQFKFLDAHSRSERKCVEWRGIEEWSVRRAVGLTTTLLLPDVAQGQSRS